VVGVADSSGSNLIFVWVNGGLKKMVLTALSGTTIKTGYVSSSATGWADPDTWLPYSYSISNFQCKARPAVDEVLAANPIRFSGHLFGTGYTMYAELEISKLFDEVKDLCITKCVRDVGCTGLGFSINDRYDGRTNGNCWFMSGEIKDVAGATSANQGAGVWIKEQAPTTPAPTTSAPTTVAPTTLAPTTSAPTAAPTTQTPTAAPTTVAPTAAPTEVPTTRAPTAAPTTDAPTAAVAEVMTFRWQADGTNCNCFEVVTITALAVDRSTTKDAVELPAGHYTMLNSDGKSDSNNCGVSVDLTDVNGALGNVLLSIASNVGSWHASCQYENTWSTTHSVSAQPTFYLLVPTWVRPRYSNSYTSYGTFASVTLSHTHPSQACQHDYTKMEGYGVPGHNIQLRHGETVASCKTYCDADPSCLAFDFSTSRATSITAYFPEGSCYTQSSSGAQDHSNSAGYENTDSYIKGDCQVHAPTGAPTTQAPTTDAPTEAPEAWVNLGANSGDWTAGTNSINGSQYCGDSGRLSASLSSD
jgi:hypothetical protein